MFIHEPRPRQKVAIATWRQVFREISRDRRRECEDECVSTGNEFPRETIRVGDRRVPVLGGSGAQRGYRLSRPDRVTRRRWHAHWHPRWPKPVARARCWRDT